MKAEARSIQGRRLPWRTISILIVGVCLTLVIGANAHLVYVALKSQPDCVPHVKQTDDARIYRAARSAC